MTDRQAAVPVANRFFGGGPDSRTHAPPNPPDSLDDVAAAVLTPAGQRAAIELLEDERRFIDLAHWPLWIGEEHTVFDRR